jgi:hypothetical protein
MVVTLIWPPEVPSMSCLCRAKKMRAGKARRGC